MTNIVINGDCKEVLKSYPDDIFDSIVTDPPYGLKFMGKDWDHSVPGHSFLGGILEGIKTRRPPARIRRNANAPPIDGCD